MRHWLLNLVATPDRAWLTLLAGILLLCREFIAPGRVIPGVLGGIGVVLSFQALSGYHVDSTGIALLLGAVAALLLQSYRRLVFIPAAAAAILAALGARWLIAPPWRISPAVAMCSVPAVALLGFLLHTAVRARRNKKADAARASR